MHAQHSAETGSPEWLVILLERLGRKFQLAIYGIFAGPHGRWLLAALSFLSGGALLAGHNQILALFADAHRFLHSAVTYILPIVISVLLLPLTLFARSPFALACARLSISGGSLVALLYYAPASQRPLLIQTLGLSFLVPLVGLAVAVSLPAGRRLWPILAFTVFSSVLLALRMAKTPGDWNFLIYVLCSLPAMPLAWLAEGSALAPDTVRPFSFTFFSYYLSSLNINYFLAVQPEDLTAADQPKRVFLQGLGNILTGLALIMLSGWFSPGRAGYASGYGTYPFIFFSTWGVLRIAVGIGQALGFPLTSPFYFPLLATDPVQHWKRWNTYFYRWYRAFIFFPVIRRTNSALLAMVLIFAANYYLHVAQYLFLPLFLEPVPPPLRNYLHTSFYFFLAHAALIYICLVTARFWPSGRSRRGWLGVGATNMAMVAIHFLRF
jgi:hypothetical protein